jgi:branched-chain amino acid transport system permease protein
MIKWLIALEHPVLLMSINSMLAMSLYISMRAGMLNLSIAGFMSIGAYIAAILITRTQTPVYVSFLLAVLLGGAIGAVLGYPVMRLRSHFLAIATLGFSAIVKVVAVNWMDLTRGMLGIVNIPHIIKYWMALPILFVILYLVICINRSRIGRAWDAIRNDDTAAATMGINVIHYKMLSFSLSTGLASFAGALWALCNRVVVPTEFDFGRLVDILMATLLGGIGHWSGPVFGAFITTLVPEFFRFFQQYKPIVTGTLLIIIVIYVPGGFIGLSRLIRRRKKLELKP